jgi:sugar phosphate isomerase/epimerase
VLAGAGRFDRQFWGRKVVYPAYFEALAASGYEGFVNWEFCHPALENGQHAGIEYVHNQTRMALEYMKQLRALAEAKAAQHGAAQSSLK